jgi:chromosome segregation ATPase
VSEDYALRAKR